MVIAERVIAAGLMLLAAYFMWHATVLPIGWTEGQGPGGGAFPFWLSAAMLLAAGGVLLRSFTAAQAARTDRFFDSVMLRPLLMVTAALTVTVCAMPFVGTYIAIPLFMLWYLRFFGRQSWAVTGILTVATPLALFFFFEVTLKMLLPKGWTEPLFYPLYAIFF
jgi:putative tricarboxylic transport membrane protein